MFSCEFCEISRNTFFTEHLWTTVSVDNNDYLEKWLSSFVNFSLVMLIFLYGVISCNVSVTPLTLKTFTKF